MVKPSSGCWLVKKHSTIAMPDAKGFWYPRPVPGVKVVRQLCFGKPAGLQYFNGVGWRARCVLQWLAQKHELVQVVTALRAAQARIEYPDQCRGAAAHTCFFERFPRHPFC